LASTTEGSNNPKSHEYTYALVVRRRALLFTGAAAGAALDQIHVQTGVLSYRKPTFLRQSWWVAPQFGVAAVAIAEAARAFAARSPDGGESRSIGLGPDAVWFVASYVSTGLCRRWPRALSTLLLLTFFARLARRDDAGRVAVFAFGLAAFGTGYEHTLSGSGAFSYADPDVGNVPLWLPILYLQGAPLAIDLVRSGLRGGQRATSGQPSTSG
jgi:hypothetical protein